MHADIFPLSRVHSATWLRALLYLVGKARRFAKSRTYRLLLRLSVDLGRDTVAVLLPLGGDLAAALLHLLDHTDLLELLEAAADDTPGSSLEATRQLTARLLVAIDLREPTHTGALAHVEAAGERGCQEKRPNQSPERVTTHRVARG